MLIVMSGILNNSYVNGVGEHRQGDNECKTICKSLLRKQHLHISVLVNIWHRIVKAVD